MEFLSTIFPDAWCIKPAVHQDNRGFFLEWYSLRRFQEHGITATFVQDNHSRSVESGTLRGLHFQKPPYAQAKLVRVTVGSVYDVIVDIRKDSPTFGRYQGFELTAGNFLMLYVPRGFAHGFCTLEPDTEFLYKVDNFYAPEYDTGIRWNDPVLGIPWPVSQPVVSDKDRLLPLLEELDSPFLYSAEKA